MRGWLIGLIDVRDKVIGNMLLSVFGDMFGERLGEMSGERLRKW